MDWQKRYIELAEECLMSPGLAMPPEKDSELRAIRELLQLKARNAKLERVAEAADTILQDKIILDTVCFPHTLFKKYQELSESLKDLEAPDA